MNWTAAAVDAARARLRARTSGRVQPSEKPSPSRPTKYGAVRTQVGQIWFDSKAEAGRYQELKLLRDAGALRDLRLQVRYPMRVAGRLVATFVADFVYEIGGCVVVEDFKGFRTPVYRLKKRLWEALNHPNTITETRANSRGSR